MLCGVVDEVDTCAGALKVALTTCNTLPDCGLPVVMIVPDTAGKVNTVVPATAGSCNVTLPEVEPSKTIDIYFPYSTT